MLTWAHPWVLWGLAAVAAAAVWSLWRPARQQATVASLQFWQAARKRLSSSALRRSRRVSLHWLLLLAGAICGVLTAAGPRIETDAPSRRIALKLVTAAQLGQNGMAALRESSRTLIGRLNPVDRVALLAPAGQADAGTWYSPGEAQRVVAGMRAVPVADEDISLPPPPPGAQQSYTFAPAGPVAGEPQTTTVLLATDLPPVTFDAIGAKTLSRDKAQLFVALRNHTDQPRRVKVALGGLHAAGRSTWQRRRELLVPPGSRQTFTMDVTPAAAIHAAVGESPSARAYLARRERSPRPVAMLGAARWSIRRFIEADPDLTLVADANQADAAICVGTTAPEGMPAVVLAPPTAPTDWRTGEPIGPLTLGAADLAADDPVMASVELAGVAVRRVRPWIATGDVKQVRLVTLDGDALALRTPEGTRPRRVWIAIDPASENTDLAVHYPLLIWLHNATAFVLGSSPESAARWTYEHRRASLSHPGWRPMDRYASGVLGPGIYTAGHRDIRAVNLLGLRGGRPQQDPVARARELPLPAATRAAEPIELWWASALIAGACWLAGWWLRMRAGGTARDGGVGVARPRT